MFWGGAVRLRERPADDPRFHLCRQQVRLGFAGIVVLYSDSVCRVCSLLTSDAVSRVRQTAAAEGLSLKPVILGRDTSPVILCRIVRAMHQLQVSSERGMLETPPSHSLYFAKISKKDNIQRNQYPRTHAESPCGFILTRAKAADCCVGRPGSRRGGVCGAERDCSSERVRVCDRRQCRHSLPCASCGRTDCHRHPREPLNQFGFGPTSSSSPRVFRSSPCPHPASHSLLAAAFVISIASRHISISPVVVSDLECSVLDLCTPCVRLNATCGWNGNGNTCGSASGGKREWGGDVDSPFNLYP